MTCTNRTQNRRLQRPAAAACTPDATLAPAIVLALAIAILAALALLGAAPAAAVTPVLKDGIPHLINGPDPRDGVVPLELEELWRRGGEDDEEILLGIVSSVLTAADGNLYVLDAQLMEVKVFAPDGRLVRTLGRQGQGPGEFENAQQIAFLPGGDAIGVTQMFPGKIVGIHLDGTPAGDIRVGDPASGGFALLIAAQSGGDNLVTAGMEIAFNQSDMSMNRHHFVRSYARDGALRHEYHTLDRRWIFDSSFHFSEAANDYVWWRLAVDHEGRVLIGPEREEYRINVYSPDGRLERVFGRQYVSWPRSAKLLARQESILEAQSAQFPPGSTRETARNEQDIWGIRCLPDGTVWVTTSRGMYDPPAGVFTVWDVFDGDGVFVKQVEARVPGRPGYDMLMITEHGYAVMITSFWDTVVSLMGAGGGDDEAEAMEIICYRIKN
jgi:hypothetical protein